ncbi:VOC family protein [Salininema proteolyticum]|uniref:VOC family protein n=1 Tax=Salininema proteolyticum TaxID=1607685 RepID=A0ABV8U599_9ACTN
MNDYQSERGTSEFDYRLHHVQLSIPAGGEDRAREYYADVLGMTEVRKPPELEKNGGLWVRTDSLEIHLGIEPDYSPMVKAHPGIIVGDLDRLAARLEEKGCEVAWNSDFIGFRRFHTRDPFGNRLEFMMPQAS